MQSVTFILTTTDIGGCVTLGDIHITETASDKMETSTGGAKCSAESGEIAKSNLYREMMQLYPSKEFIRIFLKLTI